MKVFQLSIWKIYKMIIGPKVADRWKQPNVFLPTTCWESRNPGIFPWPKISCTHPAAWLRRSSPTWDPSSIPHETNELFFSVATINFYQSTPSILLRISSLSINTFYPFETVDICWCIKLLQMFTDVHRCSQMFTAPPFWSLGLAPVLVLGHGQVILRPRHGLDQDEGRRKQQKRDEIRYEWGKTWENNTRPRIGEEFLTSIYRDLGDGLLLF